MDAKRLAEILEWAEYPPGPNGITPREVMALVEEVRRLREHAEYLERKWHEAEESYDEVLAALEAYRRVRVVGDFTVSDYASPAEIRAAERERCAKYIEAKCYSGGAPCCCELQAMFMRELPDLPSPEET